MTAMPHIEHPRTAIGREGAAVRSDLFETVNDILGLYVEADSIPALIHYLTDSLATKEYKKLAVGTALSYDTVSWARNILDNLVLENANDSIFYEFNDLAVSLAEDTLTWFDLNGAQITRMWELAESPFDIAIHAQAVLGLVLDTIFERTPEPFPFEPSGKLGEEETSEGERAVAAREAVVRVYPNPFSNTFNVQYELANEAGEVRFEVFDLTGRSLLLETVNGVQSGVRSLNLGPCKGFYLLRVVADGRTVKSEKLVCIEQ